MFEEKKKYLFLIFILYLTLLSGFFFEEDLISGASIDYTKILANKLSLFRSDFFYYFKNYGELDLRHSPIFQIFHIIFLNTFDNDIVFRIVNIHLNLLIVLIFYFCLKIKIKKNILILTSVIFIIPSFRSYSIWPDSFLCGFIFFILSVYFLLKFIETTKNRKRYYAYMNIFALSLSSYLSPNFAVFSIFYLYIFHDYFKISKSLIKIILLNCLLSLPAVFFLFIMGNNFLDLDASTWIKSQTTFSLSNLANKIILLPTIFVVYFIPFLIVDFNKTKIFYLSQIKKLKYYHYLIIILPMMMWKYLSYEEINGVLGGGGLFYNLLKFFNLFEFYLSIISSISIFIILLFILNSLKSTIFIICLMLSNPQLTIYMAYFDLILITCIFLFFDMGVFKIQDLFNKAKNAVIFFSYYLFIFILYILKENYYNFAENI